MYTYILLLAFDYFHICVNIHGNKSEWWWWWWWWWFNFANRRTWIFKLTI